MNLTTFHALARKVSNQTFVRTWLAYGAGGGTTHGTGKGATVAEAIDDLLSKPNVELPRA